MSNISHQKPLEEPKTEVKFGEQAHKEMLVGATILANAVMETMGPSGHNVIIQGEGTAPLITKDGITVARAINLKEHLPSIGAELIKESAGKTNELCGDGSSTATVLAYGLFSEGVKMIATGRSSIELKRGMDYGTKEILSFLKQKAIPVRDKKDVSNIGTISANGDRQIGDLLADAIERVGEEGIITVEPAKSFNTTLDVVEGMQFETGYVSPYFVTNQEKQTAELNNPYVLITNKKISSIQELLPVLELVANEGKPLLIIGDEIEGEALHTLIVNKMKSVLHTCAVKAPSYGENRIDILGDIATVTNGEVLDASSAMSLRNVQLPQLGTCKKVIVGRHSTTIVGDSQNASVKEALTERVAALKTSLSETSGLDDLRKSQYKKRLAKLAGGVAVLKVGGSTEVEILEKKDRVDDALNATIAAVQEGIVPGGGTALFYAARALEERIKSSEGVLTEDEKAGAQVIVNTCKLPLRVIVRNTGLSPDVVIENLLKQNDETIGYDAALRRYGNLVDLGIIDPVKVERFALEHANSVIGLMLTSNCVIYTV